MKGLFDGNTSLRKVSMRGSSARAEDAKDIVAKAAAARRERQEQKRRENGSAVIRHVFRMWQAKEDARGAIVDEMAGLCAEWDRSRNRALLPRILSKAHFLFLSRTLPHVNPDMVRELPRREVDLFYELLQIVVCEAEAGGLQHENNWIDSSAAGLLALMCFTMDSSADGEILTVITMILDSGADGEILTVSEIRTALMLRTVSLLFSAEAWGSDDAASAVMQHCFRADFFKSARAALGTMKSDQQADMSAEVLRLVMKVLDAATLGPVDPDMAKSVTMWFAGHILTLNSVLSKLPEDAKEHLETEQIRGPLYPNLRRAIDGLTGRRPLLSPGESYRLLDNLLSLSSPMASSLSSLDNDFLTSICLVWSHLEWGAHVDLGDPDEDGQLNAWEIGSEDGSEDSEPSAENEALLDLLAPVVTNVNLLSALLQSDGLLAICSMLTRLIQKSKRVESSVLGALGFSVLNSRARDTVLHRLWRYCAVKEGTFPASEDDVLTPVPGDNKAVTLGERAPVFIFFVRVYTQILQVQYSDEFYTYRAPFSIEEVRDIANTVKGVLIRSIWPTIYNASPPTVFMGHVEGRHASAKLLTILHQRDTTGGERRFASDQFWSQGKLFPNFTEQFLEEVAEAESSDKHMAASVLAAKELFRVCPILVPFSARVHLLNSQVNKAESHTPWSAHKDILIRRSRLLQDGYFQMKDLRKELRGDIKIQFVDENGLEEAGVDGGGLFKEFMTELMTQLFSPELYGLMKATWEGKLYPNPASRIIAGDDHIDKFKFMGRMLGKALQSSLLVNVPLADFFLAKMLGKFNSFDDLRSFDVELHRNLMYIRSLPPGDLEELGLTFTIAKDEYDPTEVPLIPNGANVKVTWENRLEYVYRVANFRLNTQIKEQSDALLSGLGDVIDLELIKMFSPTELQLLLQGTSGKVDTADLRSNVEIRGFSRDSQVIQWFFEVVAEMDTTSQEKLLHFITSSPRAPLRGFKYLKPNLAIHRAEGDDRLPTASTCVNLLKLPSYTTKRQLQEKLYYSINARAGFDLS